MIDMAVVGGGLAGGLAALAVRRAHPELNIAIFEAGESLGGNHRWSWFASDLDAPGTQLMAGFATTAWSGGSDVANLQTRASRDGILPGGRPWCEPS